MKKLAVIIVSVICFISCTKEGITTVTPSAGGTPPPATAGSFTWKENGVAYTADSAWFYSETRIQAYAGALANRRSITISFPGTIPGVFPINTYSSTTAYFPYTVGGMGVPATSGTLTITTYDITNNKLSGSFTNVIAGPYTLTEGSFTNLPKR